MRPRPKNMSRRDFTSRSLMAAAAVTAGKELLGSRVVGANDRVVLASIGIRGQGDSLKRGFARLANVEIKTLCDVDENLFAARANDPTLEGRGHVQARLPAGPAARARRQGRRRGGDRHPEPLARPGHDLGPAGRQTRVRREAQLPHGVGRPEDGRGGQAVRQGGPGRDHEPQPPARAPGHQVPARGRHRRRLHGARPVLQAAALHRPLPGRPHAAGREVPAQRRVQGLRARPTTPPTWPR